MSFIALLLLIFNMNSKLLVAFILCFTFVLVIPSASGCRIAYRLDDIQDYWLNTVDLAIMQLFEQREIPLTLGIIGNYIGTDPTMVNYLQSLKFKNATGLNPIVPAGTPLFEFSSHGWNHEDFSTFSLANQTLLMNESRNEIQSLFTGIPPVTTFLPPYLNFNSDTLVAMTSLGFTHLSSGAYTDPAPWPNTAPIYHFPMGASTSSLVPGQESDLYPSSADTTMGDVNTMITVYGWVVIMMHAQEFSVGLNNVLNTTQYNELQKLLNMTTALGCSHRLIRNMQLPETAPSTTAPPTSAPEYNYS